MIDAQAQAQGNIDKLESLPVELSAEMTHAIKLYRSAGAIESPALPDWSQMESGDMAERYREYLHELSVHRAQQEPDNQFLRSLAVWLNQRFTAERDRLIPEIQPLFDQAAARYREAAETLPEKLSNDSLVKGGPKVLEAFEAAQKAASEMKVYTDFVGRIEGEESRVLAVSSPDSVAELWSLVSATRGKHDPAVTKVGPALFAAAHQGVSLQLNPKPEQKRLLDALQNEDSQQTKRNNFSRGASLLAD